MVDRSRRELNVVRLIGALIAPPAGLAYLDGNTMVSFSECSVRSVSLCMSESCNSADLDIGV